MTVAMNYEPPPPPVAELEKSPELWAAFSLVEWAGLLDGVTLEMWEHIPEDFCRDHELDNGRLIRRESGSLGHQHVSIELAVVLKAAAKKAVEKGTFPCLKVVVDSDIRLWEVPCATVRRPDVLVYRCLEAEETKLWAKHVVLAVEIVSKSSRATDTGQDNPDTGFESKMTQYARSGIKHYWIVRLKPDDSAVESIEQWRLGEYRGRYGPVGYWESGLSRDAVLTDEPFPIAISWSDLEF
ncbi:Uma2 family endonuclease [Catenulispora sp. MAP12-49]|uniref:Uma2 family endonuclease n=1 Tax=Catenulispora sp. MAP12-49 TaxID=3156302 RepID=UPI0035121B55